MRRVLDAVPDVLASTKDCRGACALGALSHCPRWSVCLRPSGRPHYYYSTVAPRRQTRACPESAPSGPAGPAALPQTAKHRPSVALTPSRAGRQADRQSDLTPSVSSASHPTTLLRNLPENRANALISFISIHGPRASPAFGVAYIFLSRDIDLARPSSIVRRLPGLPCTVPRPSGFVAAFCSPCPAGPTSALPSLPPLIAPDLLSFPLHKL